MKLSTEETPHARVEMTPIMDVVFLLLVFFIYAFMTMTVQRGIKVDLPRAEGVIEKNQNIRIVLTANDELLLDGRTAMAQADVVDAVVLRHETMGLPVIISADRLAHAGPALEIMAALRAKGIDKVTYQVDKQP
jgi:biopolymer transport protein ExbD